MVFANVIVGAGIAGLTLANTVSGKSTLVLEKSRGVGGRMATRRVGELTFDHGAQFYQVQPMFKLNDFWIRQKAAQVWFSSDHATIMAAKGGMTELAKRLFVERAQLRLNTLVVGIEKCDSGWRISLQDNSSVRAERLVLTSPLPQALELLSRSNLSFPTELGKISYSKALVGMFELHDEAKWFDSINYIEKVSSEIFSVANQKSKGVTANNALTAVMSPDWSDRWFDQDETLILSEIQSALVARFACRVSAASLKKWRYALPTSAHSQLFCEPQPNLFLCGDAFGGPSIAGAYSSAMAVAKALA